MMTRRTLTITGVHGFVGRHVAKQAKEQGFFVRGVSKDHALDQVLAPYVDEYFSVDLTKKFPAEALSDAIIHLAGLAAVGPSFQNPQLYIEANSSMVTHLCEAILRESRQEFTRVLGVSSGAVYDSKDDGTPIAETGPIRFSSPYVVSKVLVENQLTYYSHRGIDTVIMRPFNHIGPGQGAGFLLPDLFERLTKLSPGEKLQTGNLLTSRDYLDVRDVARAYLAVANAGSHEKLIYNVCSGSSVSGQQILDQLCAQMGIVTPPVQVDPDRIRPTDAQNIVGSSQQLNDEFCWHPKIELDQTINDFINM